jgi:hypothetical protein
MKSWLHLVLICILITKFTFGQLNKKSNSAFYREHEIKQDEYLPVNKLHRKTSPAFRYIQHGVNTTQSTINTRQVNIDINQLNILGDAGNEPNIAIDPNDPDKIIIGWRQFDSVASNFRQAGWSYTIDGGQTWNFPGKIEAGIFRSDPVLDYDAAGNIYYNSLTSDSMGNFFCHVFKSTDGGATWDNGADAYGGDKQWMTVDRTTGIGNDNIYTFWTAFYSSCFPNDFTISTNNGSSFMSCSEIDGDPFFGTMAVGNSGELYICGWTNSDSVMVAKSTDAQLASSPSWNFTQVNMDIFPHDTVIVNPAGLKGQLNIDVDRSNGPGRDNVYLVITATRESTFDPGDVMFVRSTDGGLTWSQPIQVNDNFDFSTQWMGTMSVAPNGRIDVMWLDTRDAAGTDSSALYYSFSVDQGNTWSANEKLSPLFDPHTGYPNQPKMGDYFDAISQDNVVHLAWANSLNGEEDVYYSAIYPPAFATRVNDIILSNDISIFPNPANNELNIVSKKEIRVELINTLGERMIDNSSFSSKQRIDISLLSPGIYFLKCIDRDYRVGLKKVIKN